MGTQRGRGERRWRLVRARPEAVPASIRRMYQRLPRPRTRRALPWLIGWLGAVALGTLGWVVLATSVLGVRQIEVTGSSVATPEQVRAVAAVAGGTPLARVDTDAVAQRVRRTLPSVAAAVVSRSWPSTLIIEVIERVPVAVVAVDEGFLVLDAEGVVFTTAATRPGGVALLRVDRPGPDDPATRAALRVLTALTPVLRSVLRAVAAESPTRIRLQLSGGRVVVWGDAEQNGTKAMVATALLTHPGKTIDVSAPEVVTVS